MQVILDHYSDLDPRQYEEHLSYNFTIEGVSRALLQELARHRHQSLSVESTRYTMSKKLKFETSFLQE